MMLEPSFNQLTKPTQIQVLRELALDGFFDSVMQMGLPAVTSALSSLAPKVGEWINNKVSGAHDKIPASIKELIPKSALTGGINNAINSIINTATK